MPNPFLILSKRKKNIFEKKFLDLENFRKFFFQKKNLPRFFFRAISEPPRSMFARIEKVRVARGLRPLGNPNFFDRARLSVREAALARRRYTGSCFGILT